MMLLKKDIFVCVDIEATGLDPEHDRIIEVAAAKFTFDGVLEKFSTLIDPIVQIPALSTAIHNITQDMVINKPKIQEILPKVLDFIGKHILVGHGIEYDIKIIFNEAARHNIKCDIKSVIFIDTLRLARLYGQSKVNSLKHLTKHFNIEFEGAHRALNDVLANIGIFKRLSNPFTTTKQMLARLEKPILLKKMPLGKHKTRPFSEIPIEYLRWAAAKDFDQDLLFSIRSEIKRRRSKTSFESASNPFSNL